MPICIECGYQVARTFTTYSKADDRSLGKGVRLTQCPRCKRFADKYVEHDYVILFLDLVLIKPQVYRHLLFNRLHRDDDRLDPSIIRLGILLLLFDVYLTWVRIEKATAPTHLTESWLLSPPLPLPLPSRNTPFTALTSNATRSETSILVSDGNHTAARSATFYSNQPMMLQYFFFLSLCSLETIALHLPIQYLLTLRFPTTTTTTITTATVITGTGKGPDTKTRSDTTDHASSPSGAGHSRALHALLCRILPKTWTTRRWWPYYPHRATVSTALFVSSFTKLFPLLLLIWRYDLPSAASTVSWAVIVNNVAALAILLDCGIFTAVGLAGVGAICRAGVGWCILRAVGVESGVAAAGVVETGDLLDLLKSVAQRVGLGN